MANVSLDGYLSKKRKKDEEKEEIYRRLDKTLEDTRKEIDAYYRKGIDNVGSTRTKSFEEIEKDLENAVMEIKRDADEGVYSKSSKKTSLPGMTPQWQDPRGWEEERTRIEDERENWKRNQTIQKPYEGAMYLNYNRDKDDYIENQFQKYMSEKDYILGQRYDSGFRRNSMYDQTKKYYKDKIATTADKELAIDAALGGIDLAISYIKNKGATPQETVSNMLLDEINGIDQPEGVTDFVKQMIPEISYREYYDKNKIANSLLETTFYRYMVNDVNGYRDEYMQNLRSELLRLRSLPYTHKRQEQINKLKTVIEMNQNYQYHAEQFYKLVDDIYRNGIK